MTNDERNDPGEELHAAGGCLHRHWPGGALERTEAGSEVGRVKGPIGPAEVEEPYRLSYRYPCRVL